MDQVDQDNKPDKLDVSVALIQEASQYTSDLNAVVATLLKDYVTRERQRQEEQAALDRCIDFFNAHHLEHGLLSEEFPDG